MNRSLYVLTALLLTCATLAAPAPQPLLPGWGKPVDPDKDCKFRRGKDLFTIEMPGTDHDYDPLRKRLNAPRILREIEGEFDLQVRIQIDCRHSAQSTVKGQPPCVSAGFLLVFPDTCPFRAVCNRLDYGILQQRIGIDAFAVAPLLAYPQVEEKSRKGIGEDGCALFKCWVFEVKASGNREVAIDRERFQQLRPILLDRGWRDWPMPKMADCTYLRMKQGDKWINFFMSPDGEKWTKAMWCGPTLPAKSKVGLAAYTTSSEPSKIRFDQIKFNQGKKLKR